MKATHVYLKGFNGWGIFYSMEDCLVYFTIASVLVREMGLCVLAFCFMFNHIHTLFKDIRPAVLKRFQIRLTTYFSKEYNDNYGRSGPVFMSPYGKTVKTVMKKVISCIAYVFNNPVAGKMCEHAVDYRWTLLSYYNCRHPYSQRLIKRNSRHIMRNAYSVVDIYYKRNKHLGYAVLKRIFKGLNPIERQQLTDYIIAKYNFLNYNELIDIFGSFEKTLLVTETHAGNEYEMEDECGDHSLYQEMIKLSRKYGCEGPNYDQLTPSRIKDLKRLLSSMVRPTDYQLQNFLHLPHH